MNNQSLCCQTEKIAAELPFREKLILGFYDGPEIGVTRCCVCGRVYYFHVCYEESWSCRVYRFVELDEDYEEMATYFEANTANGWVPHDTKDRENRMLRLAAMPMTHVCASDAYIKAGIWRKTDENDVNVTNWYEHLGIVVPKNDEDDSDD